MKQVDAALKHMVEAVLFASDAPVTDERIAKVTERPVEQVRQALDALKEEYADRGMSLVFVGGGYQFLTAPRFHPVLSRLRETDRKLSLSVAAMETLSIVAYRQPITAQETAAMRGVQSVSNILRNLQSLELIRIAGRKDVLGRPMLYRTTQTFLELFGLGSLRDLPTLEEIGVTEE